MIRNLFTAILFAMAVVIGATHLHAQDPTPTETPRPLPPGVQLKATADPASLVVGDSFQYAVTVLGNVAPDQMQGPSFSKNTSLTLQDGPMQSQTMTNINGRSTVSLSYIYRVQTTEVGEQEIPPSKFLINGTWYETNAVKINVREAPAAPKGLEGVISARSRDWPQLNDRLRGKYFALAEVPEQVFRGQAVPVTVYVYRAPELAPFIQFDRLSNPSGKDFQVPPAMDVFPERWEEAALGEHRFLRTRIYTTFVVPMKTGEMSFDPPKTRLVLPLEQRQPRRIEDLYNMSPSYAVVDCDIRAMTLNVQPPPPKPDEALMQIIGSVTSQVSTDRESLQERELLTLSVSFQGEGYLDILSAPEIPDLPGLVLLNKTSKIANATRNGAYLAKRDFEYVYQATRAGEIEIPPIPVAVFDPRTGSQQVVTTEAIPVSILASSANAVLLGGAPVDSGSLTAGTTRPGAQVIGADVAYIDASRLTAAMISPRRAFYLQPWYWAAQLLPFCIAIAFGVIAHRARRGPVESDAATRKRGRQAAVRALKEAREKMKSGTRDDFYATLSRGIMGYVATMLKRAPGGLTVEFACEDLQRIGVPDEACARLEKVLRNCDTIRYSPVPDTPEAREAAAREAEELLVQLGEGGTR